MHLQIKAIFADVLQSAKAKYTVVLNITNEYNKLFGTDTVRMTYIFKMILAPYFKKLTRIYYLIAHGNLMSSNSIFF